MVHQGIALHRREEPDRHGDDRGEAYREITKIFLENFPWLPVIQPYEDYGLQKHVEWTPNPNQQFEIRKFNFKFRRA